MGWLWSSTTKPQELEDVSLPQDHPQEFPTPSEPLPSAPDIADTHTPPTRDELADAELRTFLLSLQDEASPSTSPSPESPKPQSHSSSSLESNRITPSSLHPSSISCRAVFDSAFYCQSVGGQFNNIYRYGTMRDCSEQWGQFWFCMRTNRGFMDKGEREHRVREHYGKREKKFRVGPSSEDVWRARGRRVEGAFEGDMVEAEEEFNRWKGEQGGEEVTTARMSENRLS